MTDWQTVGQHSAYYVGYLLGPLTFGRYVFKAWGFKASYMVGLSIYACGTLVFWPSAVLNSFPAFLVSNFIVGAGLSTLELSANPFIALCGPPEYAEVRLNLSQAVQAIGTIVSPILADVAGYGGVPVVHDLNLEVHPGEVVVLLGANGAGKSTTLRTLAGAIRQSAARSAGMVRPPGRHSIAAPAAGWVSSRKSGRCSWV